MKKQKVVRTAPTEAGYWYQKKDGIFRRGIE